MLNANKEGMDTDRTECSNVLSGGQLQEDLKRLTTYYNKFNEEKRLDSRHGQVEYRTSMHYIHRYLERLEKESGKTRRELRILDIGAGTGRYSIPLAEEGCDVTAVEPVKHNISRLRQKGGHVKAYQADARRMPRLKSDSYDLTLLFGPMYHLMREEEQLEALLEAKRVTANKGYLMVAYVMNEYAVLTYAFKERHIREAQEVGMLDKSYHCTAKANPLYHMVRIEDMRLLREQAGLSHIQTVASDGPANYMRSYLNALEEDEFEEFMRYHLSTCERMEMMGASGHTIDILRKNSSKEL